MSGPLIKQTENEVERTPLLENKAAVIPPAVNTTETSEPVQDAPVVEDNRGQQ